MPPAELATPLVVAPSRLVDSSSAPLPARRGESTVTRTPPVNSIVRRELPGSSNSQRYTEAAPCLLVLLNVGSSVRGQGQAFNCFDRKNGNE